MSTASSFGQSGDEIPSKEDKIAKIDSQTLIAREQKSAQRQGADASAAASNKENIRVILELDNNPGPEQLNELDDLDVIVELKRGDKVQALVPLNSLQAVAELGFVNYIRQPSYAIPSSISEGTTMIGSDIVNSAGFTGQNVTVAIIDIGFDPANPEIAANIKDIVSFRADDDIVTDDPSHGTAVAEIIVDVAPQVELFIYNVDTDVSLLAALDYIADQNEVDIVSMSLIFHNVGPLDGTSEISEAVDAVRDSGMLFVAAGGNSAEMHWEGNFVDSDSNGWRNFAGADEMIGISAQEGELVQVFLSWDDWPSSNQDYDLHIYDDFGNLVGWSESYQLSSPPIEQALFIAYYTGVYHVAIKKFSATQDVEFDLFTTTPLAEFNIASGSMPVPADAVGAFTVGAVRSDTGILEPYSSRGPTNDGRIKPDIAGPDGVITTAINPFFGSSAAAPHVAGASALVKDVYPNATADTIQLLLEENTLNHHSKNNNEGTGRLGVRFLLAGIPISEAGQDTVANEGATVSLNGTASTDSDGTIVSYFWEQVDGLPDVELENAESAVATFVAPLVSADTILTFQLTVVDELGATSSDIVEVNVKNSNQGPVANAGPDQTVSEGQVVTLNGTVTDDSPSNLTMLWRQIVGSPVVLTNLTAADPTFVAPSVDNDAILAFSFSVTDEDGLQGNDTANVFVVNFDQPPEAVSQDLFTQEDNPINITITARDLDSSSPLRYDVTSPPQSGNLNASGSTITFFGIELHGSEEVPPVSTNGSGSGSFFYENDTRVLSYSLMYSNLSSSEVESHIHGPAEPGIEAGILFDLPEGPLKIGSVDLDNLANPVVAESDLFAGLWYVNIHSSDHPDGELRGQITAPTGRSQTTFLYTPDHDFHGTDQFNFEVSDGINADSGLVTIVVQSVNDQPIADAEADQRISEGLSGSLDGTSSTDDTAIVSYFWNQTGGSPQISLSDPSISSPTFDIPDVLANTTLVFVLTVKDSANLTSTDTVEIFVIQSDSSITGRVILDQNKNGVIDQDELGQGNVTIHLSGGEETSTVTSDGDGTFSFNELPAGIYSLTQSVPQGFHTTSPNDSSYQVTVSSVSQILGGNNFLNAPNASPTADAGTNQNVTENSIIALNGTASDDFGGITLLWTQTAGPSVALTNTTIVDPTFTAPSISTATALEFLLTVTDADGANATDTVTVIVLNVNRAPVANAGPDQSVDENTDVTLNGAATADNDGNITAFAWTQQSGPPVTLSNPAIASPTFRAPAIDEDTSVTFQLNATDNEGAFGTDLVTIGINDVPSRASSGGGGGGGGGGFDRTPEPASAPTFPARYFLTNPIARIMVLSTAFFNGQGTSILQASTGQQIQIDTILQNQQAESQNYAYIVQVVDKNDVVIDLGIQHSAVEAGQSTTIGKSWQPTVAGEYTVKVYVWDSVGADPTPLSMINERTILVT